MNNISIFSLGILSGMILQTLLIFLYCSLKINDIDKK